MSVALRALVAVVGVASCGESPIGAPACAIAPGELVITEVFADPTGPDAGREWFEAVSRAALPLDLRGLTLVHRREDGSKERRHRVEAGEIGPGAVLTFGNAPSDLMPAYVSYGYGADLGELHNSSPGRLELQCAAVRIDEVVYRPARADRSLALDGGTLADAVLNDEPGRWCDTATTEFFPGAFGSPGQLNEDCEVILPGRCIDGGELREVESPAAGEVVITELMPDPDATMDALGEWIEVWLARAVDLNDLLLDRMGDAAPPAPIAAEACLRAGPGYAVLARSRDAATNGGIARVDALLPLSLVGGSAQSPGDVAVLRGAEVLDSVRWRRSAPGKSLQLDPDYRGAAANDDERVFCDARTIYGEGDRGTPGEDNEHCTILPPPGRCDDGGSTRAIVAPAAGQLVITEIMANPAGVDSEREWLEVANVGATPLDLNGVAIDRVDDTAAPAVLTAAACLRVAAGGRAVLARSADAAKNGGLPQVIAMYPLSLGDAGHLRLLLGDMALDAVMWADAPTSASLQLDPSFTTPAGNDVASHLCASTAAYGNGENLGTPGGANQPCP